MLGVNHAAPPWIVRGCRLFLDCATIMKGKWKTRLFDRIGKLPNKNLDLWSKSSKIFITRCEQTSRMSHRFRERQLNILSEWVCFFRKVRSRVTLNYAASSLFLARFQINSRTINDLFFPVRSCSASRISLARSSSVNDIAINFGLVFRLIIFHLCGNISNIIPRFQVIWFQFKKKEKSKSDYNLCLFLFFDALRHGDCTAWTQ